MQLRSQRPKRGAAAALSPPASARALSTPTEPAEPAVASSPPAKKPRKAKPATTIPIVADTSVEGDEKVLYKYPVLVPARILRRYKRFLADVVLAEAGDEGADAVDESAAITIYCPNTGPMIGLLDEPNARVQLSKSEDEKRKYAYTLEMVRIHNGERHVWVGVHSTSANYMVEQAIKLGWFTPQLGAFDTLQREVKFAKNSRVDFVLSRHDADGDLVHQKYVEVKSVTLAWPMGGAAANAASGRCAVFPDTKSDRAQKHVVELMELIEHRKAQKPKPGQKTVELSGAIVFLVQRNDCDSFMPSLVHDPKFAQLCAQAEECGIQLLSFACSLEPDETLKRGHVRLLRTVSLHEARAKAQRKSSSDEETNVSAKKKAAPKESK